MAGRVDLSCVNVVVVPVVHQQIGVRRACIGARRTRMPKISRKFRTTKTCDARLPNFASDQIVTDVSSRALGTDPNTWATETVHTQEPPDRRVRRATGAKLDLEPRFILDREPCSMITQSTRHQSETEILEHPRCPTQGDTQHFWTSTRERLSVDRPEPHHQPGKKTDNNAQRLSISTQVIFPKRASITAHPFLSNVSQHARHQQARIHGHPSTRTGKARIGDTSTRIVCWQAQNQFDVKNSESFRTYWTSRQSAGKIFSTRACARSTQIFFQFLGTSIGDSSLESFTTSQREVASVDVEEEVSEALESSSLSKRFFLAKFLQPHESFLQ